MGTSELWTGIGSWLNINAPVTAKTIRNPAPESFILSFEQAAPHGWPSDLSTLYRRFDGAEPSTAGYIFPLYRPLPLAEAEQKKQMLLSIWAQLSAEANAEFERHMRSPLTRNLLAQSTHPEPTKPYDAARVEALDAGTTAGMFIASYLPIADNNSGDLLFVDLRTGAEHGCIREYEKELADSRPAIWSSVEELLDDTLSGLRTGRPAFSARPSVINGRLNWEYEWEQ